MADFSADWLALREPADRAARSVRLVEAIELRAPATGPVRVVDLAGGTGSNVRFLAEHLSGEQAWVLVDDDPALLAQLPARMRRWCDGEGFAFDCDSSGCRVRGNRLTCRVAVERADLVVDLERVLPEGVDLVTASALLDLVSEPWLGRLVRRCRQVGAAALFGLTYDGQVRCAPEDPDDVPVIELVNRHQRRDKGFGPALGPDATRQAEQLFRASGYRVRLDNSDWALAAGFEPLQIALIEGWAKAAVAVSADEARAILAWKDRRLCHVVGGRSCLTIGHCDLAAWLPGPAVSKA